MPRSVRAPVTKRVAVGTDAGPRDKHFALITTPTRARSSAIRRASSFARMVSFAASTCSPASVAKTTLATSAAIDWRACS